MASTRARTRRTGSGSPFRLPGGIGVGTLLTATATLGGQTSEFSGNVAVANATAVTLMSFEAAASDGAVDLAWRTGSEVDNLGFHVYRALVAGRPLDAAHPVADPRPRLLGRRAPATPGATAGLQNGVRYYYRLEDVDTHSVSTFHGPVSCRGRREAPPRLPKAEADGSGRAGRRRPAPSCPAWALGPARLIGAPTRARRTATPRRRPSVCSPAPPARLLVELETGGFLTARDATGRVRALVPGFDSLSDPLAPALPLKRARLDGVVGRRARIASDPGARQLASSPASSPPPSATRRPWSRRTAP